MGRKRYGSVVALVVLGVLSACGGGGGDDGGGDIPVHRTFRDQQVWDDSVDGSGSAGALESAQTFTVGITGELQHVVLHLRQESPGDLFLDVRTLDISRPDASDTSVLRETRVPSGTIPATYAAHTIHLDPPLPVVAGEHLALCLRSPAGTYWWSYVTDAGYTGGGRHARSAVPPESTWNSVAADHLFQTYVTIE